VNLDLSTIENETTSLALYNIHGVLLKKIQVQEGRIRWDVREFQSGYYLIEMSYGADVISRERLMLIH